MNLLVSKDGIPRSHWAKFSIASCKYSNLHCWHFFNDHHHDYDVRLPVEG